MLFYFIFEAGCGWVFFCFFCFSRIPFLWELACSKEWYFHMTDQPQLDFLSNKTRLRLKLRTQSVKNQDPSPGLYTCNVSSSEPQCFVILSRVKMRFDLSKSGLSSFDLFCAVMNLVIFLKKKCLQSYYLAYWA